MRAVPKVTPPILWCQPSVSEEDVGDVTAEIEHAHQYISLNFIAVQQMTAKEQPGKMAYD